MKKTITFLIFGIFAFVSCQKENDPIVLAAESNCSCEYEVEYVCWKLNDIDQSANPVGKVVTDDLLEKGYINFGDNGLTNFFFEYEDIPTPILLNTLYLVNNSTSSDYDIGFDGTSEIDTLFLSATFMVLENTTNHISGEFTAECAITRNTSSGVENSIDLVLEDGRFRLLKQ